MTFDTHGTLYLATVDSRVRKVTPDGIISLVAGSGTGTGPVRSQGDGGPAVSATLNEPKGMAVDSAGNVYIADVSNARVRKVDTNGIITTVSGPGQQGVDYWNAVAFDRKGNLYVTITHSENGDQHSVVERVNPDGSRTRVAGTGGSCGGFKQGDEYPGDGMQAVTAPLCVVAGLSFDAAGRMYIDEVRWGSVLRVDADGVIRRVVGSANPKGLGRRRFSA